MELVGQFLPQQIGGQGLLSGCVGVGVVAGLGKSIFPDFRQSIEYSSGEYPQSHHVLGFIIVSFINCDVLIS